MSTHHVGVGRSRRLTYRNTSSLSFREVRRMLISSNLKFKLLIPGALVCLLIFELNAGWQVSSRYGAHHVGDSSFIAPHLQGSFWDWFHPPRKMYPRELSIAPLDNRTVNYTLDFKDSSVPLNPPKINPSWYTPNAEEYVSGYDWKSCEPMYDWQLQSFPNCNKFHELDLSTMRFVNSGGSRSAFELKEEVDGMLNKFVYKSIKFWKDVTTNKVEEQRKDGLLLERMTSSPFIPDIHGYCSLAVMMDFMPEGSMHDYIKGARLAGGSTLSPVDRLRVSIHIAGSVAALHSIDNTEQPSFFHNDLCCHQYLFQDGIFKLNDFNYARPIYKNSKTNEQCTCRSFGMAMWTARSLEEHQIAIGYKNFTAPKPDKIDVWMMGNIMHIIMTDLYVFEKPKNLKHRVAGKRMINGERTEIPEHIRNSTDPSYVAMMKALDMTWTYDWSERPSARSITDYLMGALRNITGESDPDLRVTLPERDPYQKNTESDYDYYND
eukprot:scaffold6920_cov171-Skeletonema_menzelii.AAC.1